MPCNPSKLKMLDVLLDAWLKARADEDLDDEEGDDIINPLEAPPQLYGDRDEKSPPQSIHQNPED